MSQKILLCLALLLPCPALADMVVLSNGDKVSGTLVEVSSGKVVIDSPLMGTLRLIRADVRSIRFGTPEQIKEDIEKENADVIKEATKKAIAGKAGADAAMNPGPAAVNPRAQPGQQVQQPMPNAHIGNPNPVQNRNFNRHANNPFGQADAMLDQLLGPVQGNRPLAAGQIAGKPEAARAQAGVDAAMQQLNQMFPGLAGNQGAKNRVQNQILQLMSGEIGLGDIRNQAAGVSRDLRASKRELQKMGAWSPMYDTYLGVLDDFVGRVDGGETLE